jgi:hypothetical protein
VTPLEPMSNMVSEREVMILITRRLNGFFHIAGKYSPLATFYDSMTSDMDRVVVIDNPNNQYCPAQ